MPKTQRRKSNNTLQQKLKQFFAKQRGQMAKIARQTKMRDEKLKKIMRGR